MTKYPPVYDPFCSGETMYQCAIICQVKFHIRALVRICDLCTAEVRVIRYRE